MSSFISFQNIYDLPLISPTTSHADEECYQVSFEGVECIFAHVKLKDGVFYRADFMGEKTKIAAIVESLSLELGEVVRSRKLAGRSFFFWNSRSPVVAQANPLAVLDKDRFKGILKRCNLSDKERRIVQDILEAPSQADSWAACARTIIEGLPNEEQADALEKLLRTSIEVGKFMDSCRQTLEQKWQVEGYDSFEGRPYKLYADYPDGGFDTEEEAIVYARLQYRQIQHDQPAEFAGDNEDSDSIQDKIFIVRPDGSRYDYRP